MIHKSRIREMQRRARITQEELVEKVGTSKATLGRWLSDKEENIPDANEIQLLAQALGTTINYLMGETDDPNPGGTAPVSMNSINISGIQNSGDNIGSITQAASPATPIPVRQTVALDFSSIPQFAVQLKEQGDKGKMQDAIDFLKSSIAVLERAIATA